MALHRIAVIGGRIEMLEAAAEFGLQVVLVHTPGRYNPKSDQLCERVIHADLDTQPEMVVDTIRRLHTDRPFDRILSLSEPGLVPAAQLNAEFGLGGDSIRTVRLLKDKSQMRRLLDEIGLSSVRHRVVGSAEQLAEFVAGLAGNPAVVKPLDGGGSAGVFRVDSVQDVPDAWARVRRSHRSCVLVEEFLIGPEISVEAFSCGGRHTVVAMTDKYLDDVGFVEVGHSVPAQLSDSIRCQTAALTVDLLTAVGLTEGPSHTEIKLTERGPRIVESHNRTGGDFIPDLVRLTHGVDLLRLAVGVPLGHAAWDHSAPPAHGAAAVRFILAAPGTVVSVSKPDFTDLRTMVELTAAPGTVVPPLTWSGDRVCGHVISTGLTVADAVARCSDAVDQIVISTEPAVQP